MIMITITLFGFVPVVYQRLTTGIWWRDPVMIRQIPLPRTLDISLCLHALSGTSWLAMMGFQLVTGAGMQGGKKSFWGKELHILCRRAKGGIASTFFLSSMCVLLWGYRSEPLGGYNSYFIREVQFCAVLLSTVLYAIGIGHAKAGHIAWHKDFMMMSLVFSTVPTGVPRFFRDVLQWIVGARCNVSNNPELLFFSCCVVCMILWPLLLHTAQRWSSNHPTYGRTLGRLFLLNCFCLMISYWSFAPKVELDACFALWYTSFL